MKTMMIALATAAVAMPAAMPAPALAQRHHSDRHHSDRHAHQRDRIRDWQRSRNYDWNRYEPGYNAYYADRYYRPGNYRERRLGRNERIYRGRDGRYYCRREDGTTGLIVGGAVGALIGNQIDNGDSSVLGTLIGGIAGALIGRELDRGGLRCR
jgi:Ni/Co efflux regulator RcnB